MRQRNAPGFGCKSLYLVFGLQAFLAWIVSAPFLVAAGSTRPPGGLDAAGAALAAFGIVFEALGDGQLARFRADPAHRGEVMDQGLWRYTRHPNYLVEACVWWGLWLTALGAAGLQGLWAAVSPLLMTALLLKVSSVRLLEKDIVGLPFCLPRLRGGHQRFRTGATSQQAVLNSRAQAPSRQLA